LYAAGHVLKTDRQFVEDINGEIKSDLLAQYPLDQQFKLFERLELIMFGFDMHLKVTPTKVKYLIFHLFKTIAFAPYQIIRTSYKKLYIQERAKKERQFGTSKIAKLQLWNCKWTQSLEALKSKVC
jgi:hypothetical protein